MLEGDPLEYCGVSEWLETFTERQRKHILSVVLDQINYLDKRFEFKWEEGEEFPPFLIAVALEEMTDRFSERFDIPKGREKDVLESFSAEQKEKLEWEVTASVSRVRREVFGLGKKESEDIAKALAELRAMLANPAQKVLEKAAREQLGHVSTNPESTFST